MNPSSCIVRRFREANRLSREALAEEAGLNPRVITRIETEDREPGVYKAIRLARAMGATVEDVFGRDVPDVDAEECWDGVARNALPSLPDRKEMNAE